MTPAPRIAAGAVMLGMTAPASASTDDAMVARVRVAVARHRLAARLDCLTYEIRRNVHPQVDEVVVRETHDRRCGGDPAIAPTVAVIRLDERHRLMAKLDMMSGKFVLLR